MMLDRFFREHPRAAIALSGGVDSAYLLYAAVRAGADIKPYFIKTPFQPAFELEDARTAAAAAGTALRVVELDTLADGDIAANGPERCYHCKRALFGALKAAAEADGYGLVIDGTNADDDETDRPGMRALRELGVRSPLRECGLRKEDIRRLSKEAGLFTWNKPAYACLATRVQTGEPLTAELLGRVEAAEGELRSMGFTDLRVRVFHGAARIQLPAGELAAAIERRGELLEKLKPLFSGVMLDMEARGE